MCGIAGLIGTAHPAEPAVRAMLALLRHRGPDDEGVIDVGQGVIGARRLSIIDLAHGHQPMTNEDGSVMVVQNGEIYNFQELRDRLIARGHRLRTDSDTEVIAHLYEDRGEDFVLDLRGMFAIALYDQSRRTLLLARDRVGKKPLYYAATPGGLAFASEIVPLLSLGVDRTVDDGAIADYLSLGYVPAPASAFRGIRKVQPGHILRYRDSAIVERRYWTLQFSPKLTVREDEAIAMVAAELDDAVRLRRISDVPLGLFLSGGLDSSSIAAVMARQGGSVRTYSIGFGEADFDELRYARLVAEHLGTDHHEYVVEPPDAAAILPELMRHFGEPFADASAVPTYYVARTARQDVTVALNGDGGDELFAGYPRYRAALIGHQTDRLPLAWRSAVAAVARAVPRHRLPRRLRSARQFALTAAMPAAVRYRRWSGWFPPDSRIRGPRLAGFADPVDRFAGVLERAAAVDRLDEMLALDVELYLAGDLLAKMDIATMSASLEARSPFLDHRLMELVARLPSDLKIRGRDSKYLLRRMMAGVLPAETLRRRKMGFGLPVGALLRGPMLPLLDESIAGGARRGYIDRTEAERLRDEHVARRADNGLFLWSLVALDLWSQEVADVPVKRYSEAIASK